LVVGFVMGGGAMLGYRRGRIMTMRKSASDNTAQWAARGDDDFIPYALLWFSASLFLVYQGFRLMFFA
jgi:hypothetical protein